MGEIKEVIQEEIVVLFHAALLGRTDVLQNAIAAIGGQGKRSSDEISTIISQPRVEDEATPLHIACQFGHKDVIRALLNAGAIVDVKPKKGENAGKSPYDVASDTTKSTFHVYFFEQVAIGNISAIQRLIDGGVPVDIRDGSSAEDSALHWACSFGNTEVAKLLLLNGIDKNIVNAHHQSALHVAAKSNKIEIVKLLLDEDADMNMHDENGKTPAHIAATSEIIALLESHPSPCCPLRHEFENRRQRQNNLQTQIFDSVEGEISCISNTVCEGEKGLYDNVDEKLDNSKESSTTENEVLLVFWPPVQKQIRPLHKQPFCINSADNLLICMSNSDIDLFPVLTWTGFMDVVDNYGFQAQVKRSAKGAKIRLSLNPHVCPLREGYQISVNLDQVVITGSDYAGLTHGVHTFLQLLQLHSLISKDQADITYVKIPAINIIDYPKIPVRSFLWSYRRFIHFHDDVCKDFVQILSKLRVNRISLIIDPICSQDTESKQSGDDQDQHQLLSSNGRNTENEATESIFILDELCDKYCVEIVPTILISSINDRLPLGLLKNFSSSMINIIILLDDESILNEVSTMDKDKDQETDEMKANRRIAACIDCCNGVLKDALIAGFSTACLSSSNWVAAVADPCHIAGLLGIHVIEIKLEQQFPVQLFSKPFICTRDYISSINIYLNKLEYGNDIQCLFPGFMDRDIFLPSILVKYYTFMYAGLAWNRPAVIDMLGEPDSDQFSTQIIGDAINLILFPNRSLISDAAYKNLLHLLSFDDKTLYQHITASHHIDIASEEGYVRAEHVKMSDISKAEKQLWNLVGMESEDELFEAPSRLMASYLLRLYRKILNESHWKAQDFSSKNSEVYSFMEFMGINNVFSSQLDRATASKLVNDGFLIDSEMEELFCCFNLLALTSRAFLVSYNAMQKHKLSESTKVQTEKSVSYQQVLKSLGFGIKSDLANSILEGLNGFTVIWKRRFRKQLLRKLRYMGLFHRGCTGINESIFKCSELEDLRSCTMRLNRRYLIQRQPVIPAYAIFRVLCCDLPLPKSLEEYVDRMFT